MRGAAGTILRFVCFLALIISAAPIRAAVLLCATEADSQAPYATASKCVLPCCRQIGTGGSLVCSASPDGVVDHSKCARSLSAPPECSCETSQAPPSADFDLKSLLPAGAWAQSLAPPPAPVRLASFSPIPNSPRWANPAVPIRAPSLDSQSGRAPPIARA